MAEIDPATHEQAKTAFKAALKRFAKELQPTVTTEDGQWAKETNRRPMIEALVMNFPPQKTPLEDDKVDESDDATEEVATAMPLVSQITLGI